jgi:predicted flap endonuclease-1-like 5' DNA nuclease
MTPEETEVPRSIGNVARRELAAHGLTRFAQLAERSERELLEIHGIGPKAVRILREELSSRGMAFRAE